MWHASRERARDLLPRYSQLVALTQRIPPLIPPPASHRKRSRMMVPSQELGTFSGLAHGCPAEFATPDHQRAVQETSLFEIAYEATAAWSVSRHILGR